MKVIPTINCTTFACAKKRIEEARTFLPKNGWLQIDVSDGKFNGAASFPLSPLSSRRRPGSASVARGAYKGSPKSWNNPEKLAAWVKEEKITGINFEIHLMVVDPKPWVMRWLEAGAKRVIVHVEAIGPQDILFLKGFGRGRVGIALAPATPLKKAEKYFGHFSFVQLLAVKPGYSGQKFERKVLEKIVYLKALHPETIIEIDGGVNATTAPSIKDAGADIIVSGSYIFDAPDKKAAYRELRKI